MAEDGGDPVAAHAFYIHKVGVGTLHQPLLLVSGPLLCKIRVHQILSQLQPRSEHDYNICVFKEFNYYILFQAFIEWHNVSVIL